MLPEPFPIQGAGFQAAENVFLKQASLALKKYLLQREQFFISLLEFHFLTLKIDPTISFSLFQTGISVSAALHFFSTPTRSEQGLWKMHGSLYNNGMRRYRNRAVVNFKLKLVKMNWGLSILALCLSKLKKNAPHSCPIKTRHNLPVAPSFCSPFCPAAAGRPPSHLQRIWRLFGVCSADASTLLQTAHLYVPENVPLISCEIIPLNHLSTSENLR